MYAMVSFLFRCLYSYAWKILNTVEFSTETHVVNRIVCINLYPVSHMSTLRPYCIQFLYALLIGHFIDIVSHICYYMLKIYYNLTSRQDLPFPCLIQGLVTTFTLPSIDGKAPLILGQAICKITLSQCETQLRRNAPKRPAIENPS